MDKRQLKELENAINYVKRNGFEVQLAKELIEANKILLQLRRLERIRAEILELKQSTVAEIRSYQKPPPIVHKVMTATFLVLGHKEKETKVGYNIEHLQHTPFNTLHARYKRLSDPTINFFLYCIQHVPLLNFHV